MAKGIVLGGGGTLGDFQVGALKFLYEKGILSDIKCVSGTSIGAINALIVSTGKGCDERLESYWSDNVLDREDLIPQHNWSEDIGRMLKAFVLSEKHSRLSMELRIRSIGRIRALAAFLKESRGSSLGDIKLAINDLEDLFGTAIRESAIYSAHKLKERLEKRKDTLQKALNPTIAFCLYAVNVETGQKTCFTNNAQLVDLRGDTRYVQCHSSNMLVEAALASAAVPVIFPSVAVRWSHGEACEQYYMDGSVREVVPITGAIACKADEIYAILCFPRFTDRRKYAYLDLKDAEGKIVSSGWCTSNLLDIQPEDWVVNNRNWNPTSDECDVLDVANRTAAILLDEMTKGDLVATDEFGDIATDASGNRIKPKAVIAPLIPVHGWTQLNIGLLKINADQGYMRAFDVLCAATTPIEEQCEELTAEITARRIKIWALEHELIEEVAKVKGRRRAVVPLLDGPHVSCISHQCCENVVNTTMLRDIRHMKKELKEYVDLRRDIVEHSSLSPDDKRRCVPDDYVCMYMCWEPHNWTVEGKEKKPLIPSPWHELDLGKWGSDVIEEDWSLGYPPIKCKSRSLLSFRRNSHQLRVT